ncbi:hypothetical protein JHK87_006418 [Glycine soja]|nr:hypothetical protein JHK87_006418 [Glycine soja]
MTRPVAAKRETSELHAASDAPNAFVHDVLALCDLFTDTRKDDATVQVPVPKARCGGGTCVVGLVLGMKRS